MRDIPLFTAANGMATLILHEIPFRGDAFVWIRTLYGSIEGLIKECQSFCSMAGAERVYFSGDMDLSAFPLYARLIYRSIDRAALPATEAVAVPVEDPVLWLEQYRRTFRQVPAAQSTPSEEGRYDIRMGKELIGIGQIQEGMLMSVASLRPGMGAACVSALCAHSEGPRVRLVCAEENLPAMKLYDRMGFSKEEVKEVWYSLSNRSKI